ncbi:alpha/beta hydrolase [Nocardioides dilutus]
MDASLFPSLDPDLVGMVRLLPDLGTSLDDLDGARAVLAAMAPPASSVDTTGLEVRDLRLDELGSPASVRVYRPADAEGPLPGLLFLHGGGFVLGSVDLEHQVCVDLARDLGVVVASVDYRLAPEHPYPAGLEDCYAALRLLAGLPGVDPARVAVHGQSAGGCLSAALALLTRDRGGPALCFQSLDVPVIDDRLETASMRSAGPWLMWSPSQAAASWRLYLAGRPADQYAAPGRAEDLSGLPPAYVVTCELDPLRDEGIDYATRLMAAGVPVELHCWPGVFHGVQVVPDAAIVKRMNAERLAVLGKALGVAGPASSQLC